MFQMDEENGSEDLMGMRQALFVPALPKDFDPTVPPTSGEEYLQQVIYESKKFSNVFVAKRVDASILNAPCDPQIPEKTKIILSSPQGPSKQWQEEQINEFTRLRKRIQTLRLKNSVAVQSLSIPEDENIHDWRRFLSDNRPVLSVLFALRQEQLEQALRSIADFNASQCLRMETGEWLYAISASLQHPLSREACGDLRDIARKCSKDRDHKNSKLNGKEIAMMNLIITIVVEYFRQSDLCD